MNFSREENENKEREASPSYAHGQILRALDTRTSHPDPQTRERAKFKAEKWFRILQGMLAGRLKIGSRNPDASKPTWITLEVMKGGFSTGEAAASGPLRSHEIALLDRLEKPHDQNPRLEINSYYLSEAGFSELVEMLDNGNFRIDVPEESCLLTIAWLAVKGHTQLLNQLVGEITPWLDSLRFYPIPSETPYRGSNNVYVQPLSDTIDDLDDVRVPDNVLIERESATVWAPLYDRLISLFVETVTGPAPELIWKSPTDGNSKPEPYVSGGWPCQTFPEGWRVKAKDWLEEFNISLKNHPHSPRPTNKKRDYAKLKILLQLCCSDPGKLSGRDVGLIRVIIAGAISKRGLPESSELMTIRQTAVQRVNKPTTSEIAKVLQHRLNKSDEFIELDCLGKLLQPVSALESRSHSPLNGAPIPPKLAGILKRSLYAPLEVLIAEKVVVSSDMVAEVLPQLTAHAYSDDISDSRLRRVLAGTYQAFRRRRSLLLLNYQHQVRLEELPWVQAVSTFRYKPNNTDQALYSMLQTVTVLILESFPYAVFPNKLLQEYRQLADNLRLDIPITEELAADIFMGEFRVKFFKAAQQAAAMLAGSLYQKYYEIPYEILVSDRTATRTGSGVMVSPTFTNLCYVRAGQPMDKYLGVAGNGCVIEQAQVLTTHNLASIISALDLKRQVSEKATQLAEKCFDWICKEQRKFPHHIKLYAIKNCAYAWRQMVFFLSLVPEAEAQACVSAMTEKLDTQSSIVQKRLTPVLSGLREFLDLDKTISGTSRRPYYGWTASQHWMQN